MYDEREKRIARMTFFIVCSYVIVIFGSSTSSEKVN